MKIRSGFVSNSSSSSFVVVAPKAAVDNVLKNMESDYERACVEHVMSEEKFLGQTVCVFQGMSGNYDSWEYDFSGSDHDGYEEDESPHPIEVFDDFTEKLQKETKDVIKVETDC